MTHFYLDIQNNCKQMEASWSSRPNPEDRINRKPGDQKNDQTTEKAKKHETK